MGARDVQRIERLRAWRASPVPDVSLRDPLASAAREFKRQARTFGSLGSAWTALAPEGVGDRAALVSLARGVLTVRCEDAATRFELDRWLRGGGETALISRASAKVNRVKLVL
jgi:hypothetical protein